MTDVDPIQLEIIRSALVAAAEEMSVTIWRTARSTVVREMLDYSTAIFDARGRNVAQATRIPVHLNSMATCLEEILAKHVPLDQWQDGDVVVTNDPYCGGQHLPDIQTYRPVFLNGERIAIVGTLCHHIDVGGGAAGSYSASAREVYQEGLRIPPVKVVEAGRPNRALLAVLRQNSREPDMIMGDFAAQLASLDVGARAMLRLARRYGTAPLRAAMARILDQSEAAMRAAIRAMPDGTYGFEDVVDDDGIEDRPLAIRTEVTIAGDEARVAFAGTSAQAAGPVNCTLNMSRSAVYCAFMMAAEGSLAANSGCYRPIAIDAPEATVVNCRHPAPVANRMATGHRVLTTVLGALAQAVPARIPAAYYGVSYVYSVGTQAQSGAPQVYLEIEVGGWGAHPDADGANGFSAGFHNLANSPIEMVEHLSPVSFVRYGLAPDTGGAGRRRGGLGLWREFRLEAESGQLNANFDRFKVPPYGLAGGAPGAPGRFVLVRGNEETALASKLGGFPLRRGDRVRLVTSGGGGHGDPGRRERGRVAADVAAGYVSAAAAARLYGDDAGR